MRKRPQKHKDEMTPQRFRNSSAGRVIQVGRGEAAYWAFVPHSLPPRLEWDRSLIHQLSEADRALGELAGLGQTMPNPHLLMQGLRKLERTGILKEITGRQRHRLYAASAILELLDEREVT